MAKKQPDDPKAKEYSEVLINQSLMQAKIDKLETDMENVTKFIADLYILLTSVAKSVQQLQDWILKR